MKEENLSDSELPSEKAEKDNPTKGVPSDDFININDNETNLESNGATYTSKEDPLKSSIKSLLDENFDENIDMKTTNKSGSVNIFITVKIKGSIDNGRTTSQEPGDQQLKQLPHGKSRTKKSRLQCRFCGKIMSSDYRLKCHVRKHTGASAGKCTFCGKDFSDGTSLKRHYKTCQREKSFPCQLCKKIFKSQKRLDMHIASHPLQIKEEDGLSNQKIQFGATSHSGEKNEVSGGSDIESSPDDNTEDLLLSDRPAKPLICRFCGKVLANHKALEYHENKHAGERPIVCQICDKIFFNPKTAQDHIIKCEEKLGHEGGKTEKIKQEIEDCDVKVIEENMNSKKPKLDEVTSQHPVETEELCQFCGLTFYSQSSLKNHLKTCKLSGSGVEKKRKKKLGKKSTCEVCGKSVRMLDRHILIHTGEKPYQCLECGERFRERGMLIRHNKSLHRDIKLHKCSICEKQFRGKFDLTSHMRIHTEKEHPFRCDVCSKCFSSERTLKCHKEHHSDERQHLCTLCGKTYKRVDTLNAHRFLVHNIAKPYSCERCGRGFLMMCYLTKHRRSCDGTVENKATKAKYSAQKFKCDVCAKSLSSRLNLENHMRSHTGENPFICSICGKSYTSQAYLKFHLLNHSDDKPFKCNDCEKSFVSANLLKIHMRIHTGETPFKCDICSREFNKADNLLRHKKIHEDKRPFECKTCGMTFKFVEILKRHERRHTGEKPFKCSLCERAFSDPRPLKKHMLMHN